MSFDESFIQLRARYRVQHAAHLLEQGMDDQYSVEGVGKCQVSPHNHEFFLPIKHILDSRHTGKWKYAEEVIETVKEPTIEITREMIEGHIQHNLTRASLNMLMDDLSSRKSQ